MTKFDEVNSHEVLQNIDLTFKFFKGKNNINETNIIKTNVLIIHFNLFQSVYSAK